MEVAPLTGLWYEGAMHLPASCTGGMLNVVTRQAKDDKVQ